MIWDIFSSSDNLGRFYFGLRFMLCTFEGLLLKYLGNQILHERSHFDVNMMHFTIFAFKKWTPSTFDTNWFTSQQHWS